MVTAVLFFYDGANAAATNNNKAARPILKTPFYILNGGIVIIQAQLPDHADTLNFILDTGSGAELLDSEISKKYSLPLSPSNHTIEGIGGKKTSSPVYFSTLKIENLLTDTLRFYIDNLQFLSKRLGTKISGVLGRSFFKQFIIEINHDNNQIKFYYPQNFIYPKKGIVLPLNIHELPIINAFTADQKENEGKFVFDMGADVYLMVNKAFLKDQQVFSPNKKMYPMEVEGIGGKKEMYLATMQTFTLGKYSFKKVPVMVFDDQSHFTEYPLTNGILGNGILRRFNILLNYSANEIHLLPNGNFNESFNYSYTGLSVYESGNKVFVSGVIKNSPADKAGFVNGDEIIAVNDQSLPDLEEVQNYLFNLTRQLIFTVNRNDKEVRLKLTVESILSN